MRCFNKTLLMILAASLSSISAKDCFGYEVSASNIYMQASKNNTNYLRLIKRYKNAIDLEDANGNTLTDKCVLLPLKPRFFDFFTIEDLQEGIVKLKVVQNEKIYKVTIEIPIKNNRTIKYEKDYTTEPNDKENVPEGEIKEIETHEKV